MPFPSIHGILSAQRGEWTPFDMPNKRFWIDKSNTLSLYQDAAMSIPVTANLDVIGAAYDLSGSGNNATQSTTSGMPIYRTGIQNGLSIGRYDVADDVMEASVAWTNSFTVFLVSTPTNSSGKYIFGTKRTAGYPAIITGYNGLSYEWYAGIDRFELSAGATGQNAIAVSHVDNSYVRGYFNDGVSPIFAAVPTYVINGTSLQAIGSSSPTSGGYDGDFGEMLITAPAASTNDIANMMTYFRNKWGTP